MMHLLHLLSALLPMLIVFHQGGCMREGIVGGHEAKPHSHPYMVYILYKTEKENSNWSTCDGFLVREDFVMTAAHCKGKRMFVFPGFHNISDISANSKRSAKPHAHPDYPLDKASDIMLLKITPNITLNDWVKLLALPQTKDDTAPTTNCLVAGWGVTAFKNGTTSDVLKEVNVTVGPSLECDTPKTICHQGSEGPLMGDSGGPLICGNVAYGVVSALMTDHTVHTYMYTRVTHYTHWIIKIMNHTH